MHNFKRIIWCLPAVVAILVFTIYTLIYLYNKSPIVCSDVSTLEDMLRIDFSDVKIVDIQSDISEGYTKIVICVRADAEYTNGDYFVRTNYSNKLDKNFEWIPAAEKEMLHKNSLEIDDIYQYGLSYSEIRNGMSDVQCEIRWYDLGNMHGENTNLIFSALIPRPVIINMSIVR